MNFLNLKYKSADKSCNKYVKFERWKRDKGYEMYWKLGANHSALQMAGS